MEEIGEREEGEDGKQMRVRRMRGKRRGTCRHSHPPQPFLFFCPPRLNRFNLFPPQKNSHSSSSTHALPIHTHTHTDTHTHTHTHRHTDTHTHTQTHRHTHTQTDSLLHSHTRTHTRAPTQVQQRVPRRRSKDHVVRTADAEARNTCDSKAATQPQQ